MKVDEKKLFAFIDKHLSIKDVPDKRYFEMDGTPKIDLPRFSLLLDANLGDLKKKLGDDIEALEMEVKPWGGEIFLSFYDQGITYWHFRVTKKIYYRLLDTYAGTGKGLNELICKNDDTTGCNNE